MTQRVFRRKKVFPMKHDQLVRLISCAVFAAFLCLCAPLTVPVGPIPFSMLIFAVMLCGVVLRWKEALLSIVVFLALSLFLPVFHGGNTGATALPGPTGGYIWSYSLVVVIIHLLGALPVKQAWLSYGTAFLGCAAGLAVCYLCGTFQYRLVAGVSFRKALGVCVIPFIGPDLIKAALASLLGVTLRTPLRRLGYLPTKAA